jgi:hypothetical protein
MLTEALVGIVTLAIGDGYPVLGLSLLLDATARLAGTVATGQSGDHAGAWTVMLLGTPALLGMEPETDTGRVARSLAIAAAVTFVLGLLTTAA